MPTGPYKTQYTPQSFPPTHFSIDVECIATGPTHLERAVAQISLVVSPSAVPCLSPLLLQFQVYRLDYLCEVSKADSFP